MSCSNFPPDGTVHIYGDAEVRVRATAVWPSNLLKTGYKVRNYELRIQMQEQNESTGAVTLYKYIHFLTFRLPD